MQNGLNFKKKIIFHSKSIDDFWYGVIEMVIWLLSVLMLGNVYMN